MYEYLPHVVAEKTQRIMAKLTISLLAAKATFFVAAAFAVVVFAFKS